MYFEHLYFVIVFKHYHFSIFRLRHYKAILSLVLEASIFRLLFIIVRRLRHQVSIKSLNKGQTKCLLTTIYFTWSEYQDTIAIIQRKCRLILTSNFKIILLVI